MGTIVVGYVPKPEGRAALRRAAEEARLRDSKPVVVNSHRGPAKILDRFGSIEPGPIADADPDEFAALCATTPAVHRFPGSMAGRIQQLARIVVEEYGGQADRLWTGADSGRELMRRLQA